MTGEVTARDILWDSRLDLGILESFAFIRVRSSFLAAFKACGVAIADISDGSGVWEGASGMSGMIIVEGMM